MPRVFKINVNNTEYNVTVEELTSSTQAAPTYTPSMPVAPANFAAPAATAAAPTLKQAGSGDQCAQMAGVISSILVKEGQSVNEGEKIIELEAMKMKVPVMANCSGKISRILVTVGDGVSGGQPLLTIA